MKDNMINNVLEQLNDFYTTCGYRPQYILISSDLKFQLERECADKYAITKPENSNLTEFHGLKIIRVVGTNRLELA